MLLSLVMLGVYAPYTSRIHIFTTRVLYGRMLSCPCFKARYCLKYPSNSPKCLEIPGSLWRYFCSSQFFILGVGLTSMACVWPSSGSAGCAMILAAENLLNVLGHLPNLMLAEKWIYLGFFWKKSYKALIQTLSYTLARNSYIVMFLRSYSIPQQGSKLVV